MTKGTMAHSFGEVLEQVTSSTRFLLFDGAMGTMLQRSGLATDELPELLCLQAPDGITAIHHAYVEAGSDVVTTNTFGANHLKLDSVASVESIFNAAVKCARDSGARFVAADVGPIGKLIFPMGELSFSEAYDLFAEQGEAIEKTDADLVIIETMADILEMTAAVIAIRDTCSLPVFATMTFTAAGRTFLGTAPANAALALGALGVDALGVNCSAGPADLAPVVFEMLESVSCPVIVQANAGLPEVVDGKTVYAMAPSEYAQTVLPMVEAGASILGGCCGTDPTFIEALAQLLDSRAPTPRAVSRDAMFASARIAADDDGRDAEILAEILDAPNHSVLKEALQDEYDLD